jgi:hydroxyacylglutathione hydrolase
MEIRQFVDEGLGNSTHLVISRPAGVAAVIDPPRDVDRYLDTAAAVGVRISHVFETHIHNDFVSGGRELAARVGARVVASAAAELGFDYQGVDDGDTVTVGEIRFRVIATPGHTPEHISYLAEDLATPEQAPVLFSGGSLLVGAVSRTDLLGHEHTVGLGRQLFASLHGKLLRLPDLTEVYPTHGAGSFCSAAPGGERHTTIGQERRLNAFLQLATPEAFVAELQRVMSSYPTYFHQMRALNRRGAPLLGTLPDPIGLSPAEVLARMDRGEAVVDTRPVSDYVRGHVPRAYHVELRPVFAAWVGWMVPFGTPIILVSDTPRAPEEAVHQLRRIGYDDLPGYLAGGLAAWERAGLPVARTPVLTMREVRERLEHQKPLAILDIRQDAEWETGHLPPARHVEAGAIAGIDLTVPDGTPIATHCEHGQRSATALSVLERRGFGNLRLITDGLQDWRGAGGAVVREGRDGAAVGSA